jgi:lycopene beta-cyclase
LPLFTELSRRGLPGNRASGIWASRKLELAKGHLVGRVASRMRTVAAAEYDVAFLGGGLAATLLLNGLRTTFPKRVAVIDPWPTSERPPVHWSYWSRGTTPYDRFAVGTWLRARVADAPPESIAPFALRLVRSTDVLAAVGKPLVDMPIDWLRASAFSVRMRTDGLYEVETDVGAVRASWVFDSACGVEPTFPSPHRPRALLSGTGLRVEAGGPTFDNGFATLFDPLDERSFAYLLPLSTTEALLESASFGSEGMGEDREPLLGYLRSRYPGVDFSISHSEYGTIPLGFAPPRTVGPRHVLIGAKRGLVKPSAGYGVVRIAEDCERLARLWKQRQPLPPSRRSPQPWRLLDKGFVRLAAQDPRLPMALLGRVMSAIPLAQSLSFISEELRVRELGPLLRTAAPVVFGNRRERLQRN